MGVVVDLLLLHRLTKSMCDHQIEDDPQLKEVLSSIDTDRLCAAASSLKPDVDCMLGETIVGGECVRNKSCT